MKRKYRCIKMPFYSSQGQIDRAQIQFNLADTLELMSRTEDAIAEYLKIPDLYPNKQRTGHEKLICKPLYS